MARGAGGSPGGTGRFFLGLAMIIGGGYLFLSSIRVGFGWGHGLFRMGGYTLTGGMVLIPAIFGFVLIFFNAKNPIGWVLACGSVLALSYGVIRSIQFHLIGMTAFDLIVILVLLFGGIGLFAGSLRDFSSKA
jgi:hypothetical protein